MKLVFMGTPDFAVPTLEKLISEGHDIGYVVTQPDRARNRKQVTFSPVKQVAVDHGIPVLQPERLRDSAEDKEKLAAYEPDAIIVVAYGQILKEDILNLPTYGCYNVHSSLLPKLRGAAPMQHAILGGFETTGVTIMQMDVGLDSGDIISQEEVPVGGKNFEELHDELAVIGANLLAETLPRIADGTASYQKQNEEEVTYAPILKKSDGKIDFHKKPQEIEQQIRAFDPWPGAFCTYGGKTIKIWKAECPGKSCNLPEGQVAGINPDSIDLSCGGEILRILELQLPGKRRTMAADFLRGHKVQMTDTFE